MDTLTEISRETKIKSVIPDGSSRELVLMIDDKFYRFRSIESVNEMMAKLKRIKLSMLGTDSRMLDSFEKRNTDA